MSLNVVDTGLYFACYNPKNKSLFSIPNESWKLVKMSIIYYKYITMILARNDIAMFLPGWLRFAGFIIAIGTDGPCRVKPITLTPFTWPGEQSTCKW